MTIKPTFNVSMAFEGVTTIQMNRLMASLVIDHILDIQEEEPEDWQDLDLEEVELLNHQLHILSKCMKHGGSFKQKSNNIAFSVDKFGEMISILANPKMVDALLFALKSCLTREVIALTKALADPVECMERRMKKYGQKAPAYKT
jgi:hypothetical protein